MRRPEGFDRAPDVEAPARPARPARAARPADPAAEIRAAARARRREERAEVRRFTRAARRRRTGWLVVLGVLGSAAGLVALAVFSPLLALREIEVSGTDRVDPEQVAAALEGELGTPLALLDEGRVAAELSGIRLIRSFAIELVPPGTMRVVIDEREPVGVVVSDSVFQLVDPAGIVIEESAARPEDVPLLDLPAGDDGAVREAVAEVLLALPDDVRARVDRITARTRDDVAFTLRGSDQRVVWGAAADSERKALVLEVLLARWEGSGPGEYDVSAARSAVFREL